MLRDNIFLIYFSLVIIFCSENGFVQGIMGGNDVLTGDFSYTVSVQNEKGHICGGAIINEYYVLTAARCIVNKKRYFVNEIFSVVYGVTNLGIQESGRLTAFVKQVYIPAEFKFSTILYNTFLQELYTGDIAVLKLYNGLGLHQNLGLKKLTIPKENSSKFVKESNVIITGFGISTKVTPEILRDPGNVELYRNQCNKLKFSQAIIHFKKTCRAMFKNYNEKHICAQIQTDTNNPVGVCYGDSGSPLVLNGSTVVGILFYNKYDCDEKWRGALYTRVSAYATFIENAINGIITSDMRSAVYQITENGKSQNLVEMYSFI